MIIEKWFSTPIMHHVLEKEQLDNVQKEIDVALPYIRQDDMSNPWGDSVKTSFKHGNFHPNLFEKFNIKVLPKIIPNETAYLLDDTPKYSLAGNLLKDVLMGEQIDYKNIKPNTIKDFIKLNIEKQHIQKWIDKWNQSTIEDRIYACNQTEKESNLRSIRNKFKKDDLTYQLTTYDFEKMFKKLVRSDDISWTLTCYAGSRFDPPPSQFINNFNQLANNKNSNTNSFDSPIQYPES